VPPTPTESQLRQGQARAAATKSGPVCIPALLSPFRVDTLRKLPPPLQAPAAKRRVAGQTATGHSPDPQTPRTPAAATRHAWPLNSVPESRRGLVRRRRRTSQSAILAECFNQHGPVPFRTRRTRPYRRGRFQASLRRREVKAPRNSAKKKKGLAQAASRSSNSKARDDLCIQGDAPTQPKADARSACGTQRAPRALKRGLSVLKLVSAMRRRFKGGLGALVKGCL
jgi:hypothetical protein